MIHSSAIIAKNAEIHETTHIGPFCIIGDGVKIGENNNLISHVSIVGNTTIENSNTFYPFCSKTTSIPKSLATSTKVAKKMFRLSFFPDIVIFCFTWQFLCFSCCKFFCLFFKVSFYLV